MEEFNKSVTGGMVRRLVRVGGVVFEPKGAKIAAIGSLYSMNGPPRKQKCCAIDSAICEGYWDNSVAAEVPEESAADNRQAVDSRVRVATQQVVEAASTVGVQSGETGSAAQIGEWQTWGVYEWVVDDEGCLAIRPEDGAEIGRLLNDDSRIP